MGVILPQQRTRMDEMTCVHCGHMTRAECEPHKQIWFCTNCGQKRADAVRKKSENNQKYKCVHMKKSETNEHAKDTPSKNALRERAVYKRKIYRMAMTMKRKAKAKMREQ